MLSIMLCCFVFPLPYDVILGTFCNFLDTFGYRKVLESPLAYPSLRTTNVKNKQTNSKANTLNPQAYSEAFPQEPVFTLVIPALGRLRGGG